MKIELILKNVIFQTFVLLEKPKGHGSKHDIFHMGKINHQNQAKNRERFKPKNNKPGSRDRSRSPIKNDESWAKGLYTGPSSYNSTSEHSNSKNSSSFRTRNENSSSSSSTKRESKIYAKILYKKKNFSHAFFNDIIRNSSLA